MIETVVTTNSPLLRRAAESIALHERHSVNLLEISRSGVWLTQGLRDTKRNAGDVIVLQGPLDILPERLSDGSWFPQWRRLPS